LRRIRDEAAENALTDVANRIAFITGAAHGIGLGIARALAQCGVKLALADVDEPALNIAKGELEALTEVEVAKLDVRDRVAFARVADVIEDRLGPVSLLFNNAGVAGGGDLSSLDYAMWDWSLGINVGGVINGTQTFLPRMIERNEGGYVVNTASASGLVGGTATIPYCTGKFAIVGMSESLRPELHAAGIGISVLCPGPVDTSILPRSALSRPRSADDAAETDSRMSAVLQRAVKPDEVGEMVLAAIRRDQFYIFTDRVIFPALADRHCEIIGSMPSSGDDSFTMEVAKTLRARRMPGVRAD
jgi:NAD(P)-dependent dehydrogenase (short-subunit alcohol dehydrogenase family)